VEVVFRRSREGRAGLGGDAVRARERDKKQKGAKREKDLVLEL